MPVDPVSGAAANLDTDPGENRNLLKVDDGVPPSVLATVKAELALARTCAGVSCP